MKDKAFFCKIVFILLLTNFLFAGSGILSIPDSSSIREQSMEAWISAPISAIIDRESENVQTEFGQVFQVRAEREGSEVAVIFAPRENSYNFLEKAPGSWVVYRDYSSGKILRIMLFF